MKNLLNKIKNSSHKTLFAILISILATALILGGVFLFFWLVDNFVDIFLILAVVFIILSIFMFIFAKIMEFISREE